jgi:dolichyl-phosphooligosaccharide-protein glycotransferase
VSDLVIMGFPMNAKEILSKLKPLIIIILLFTVVFSIRADAVNINGVPHDYKSLFEDQNGLPYFSEMDSYYNYRMTQDYLNHGYLGDTIINGTHWDLHSNYPSGRSAEYPPLIVVITAFVYKLVNSFANIPLNEVAIWIAPLVASLAVIPAYLFVRRLTNDYGGIAAGLLVGLATSYFNHTFAGFFDTDIFNVIFPILVVGFFIVGILAKNVKTRLIYVVLSVVSLLIYSAAWAEWWYLFYLVTITVVVYLLVSNYLFNIKTINPFKDYSDKIKWFLDQPALFSLTVFIIVNFVLLSIYLGPSGFISAVTGLQGVTQLQSVVQGTSYPNVYLTVSEMQASTFGGVVEGVGGYLPIIFGILVVPLLLWKLKPDDDNGKKEIKTPKRKSKPRRRTKRDKVEVVEEKIEKSIVVDSQIMESKKNYLLYAVLFTVWLLAMGYLVTKGARFIEQFSIPIALGAGISVGLIVPYFQKYIKNARYSALAALFMIAVLAYAPVSTAYNNSNSVVPGTDDSMYNSMIWIKNNTPQNMILTSWWDFGHLFAAVADRPVTFDGGSQNTPRAYWVGRALTTSNENLSAGILRMMTSSGDQGILTLENYTHDTGKSVEILNKILPVDKQSARAILINDYDLTSDQAQNVLQYTHPDNSAPHDLIISSDMLSITKSGAWSEFGNWNFQNNTGQGYLYSIEPVVSKNVNGKTVIAAQNGVVAQVNGTKVTAGVQYSQNNQTQILSPYRLIVIQNGSVVMNQLISNESSFDILLIKENNVESAVLMNKELENSMATRLYLMNGAGLSKFKLLHKEGGILDPYGVTIWSVN